MRCLFAAAMLVAMGAGAAGAQTAQNQASIPAGYQCPHVVAPGSLSPSDDSYGKHLASQYNTEGGA